MSELQTLYLVLAGIYLADCFFRFRRESVFFYSRFGFRIRNARGLYGNEKSVFAFTNPFSFAGRGFVGAHWPFSLSPEGIAPGARRATNPGRVVSRLETTLSWRDLRSLRVEGANIILNDRVTIETESPAWAHYLSEIIERVSKATKAKRKFAIESALRAFMNSDDLAEAHARFKRSTRLLRVLSIILVVFLFLYAPLPVYAAGLANTWPGLVLGLLAQQLLITGAFARLHKQLFPERKSERRGVWLSMLFSPASAMRAADYLSRHFFMRHPMAIAGALARAEDFAAYARLELRDALHPLPAPREAHPAALETADWFHALYVRVLRETIAKANPDFEVQTGPPALREGERSYCPRCETRFMAGPTLCDACGIELDAGVETTT